jgi:cytochrome c5
MLLTMAMSWQLQAEEYSQGEASDLPPAGRSAFDLLMGNEPVPFPFSRLLSRIETGLVKDGLPPVKVVLIPLGRSLQRAAGAPEFFRYPRVVATVDGENRPGAPPLKDRLFLGYHEKGEVVEVISYNERAGRFEFQVVRDYRPGATPRVFYARRSLCLACHQNAAPIFARPLWDETSANPAIAARLSAEQRDFYGVPVTGTDIAYFVDAATDRANMFSVWQTLWQRGCGSGAAGDRCRTRAMAAALRYALSGALPPADALAASLPELDTHWRCNWPQGLAIPNPDIPNRDPLMVVSEAALASPAPAARKTGGNAAAELATLAHVPAAFEPLQLRPPLEIWRKPDLPAFIAGLAGLLDSARVKQLGDVLASGKHASESLPLDCALTVKDGGKRLRFRCADQGRSVLEGHLEIRGTQVTGTLDSLRLTNAVAAPDLHLHGVRQGVGYGSADLFLIPFIAGKPAPTKTNPCRSELARETTCSAHSYRLNVTRGQHAARLSDGRRVDALVLDRGGAKLVIRDDFAALAAALELQREHGAFAARPVTSALLDSLLEQLGAPAAKPARHLPPAQVEVATAPPSAGIVGRFRRHCGACHDTSLAHPPNFLRGDDAAAGSHIAQCAERIYYRLSMWSAPVARRGKTPMPPLAALASQGFQPQGWTASPELVALRGHAEKLLRAEGRQPAELLGRPFESLRPCLPAAPGHAAARP